MTDWQIVELGHPLLRQTAAPVADIHTAETQQLLEDLLAFVQLKQGMDIAAPQVGISQQIFILSSHPNERYPYAPQMMPTCVINPRILAHSETQNKDWEGCLSIPGIRALVPRYDTVRVEYQRRDGQTINTVYEGFLARVFQHELDHLNGILFIDRAESTRDMMTERQWRASYLNR